jgi:F420-dependent oxidoreductase-like protein
METGVVVSPSASADNQVACAIGQARRAHAAGVNQIWLPQGLNYDAIALAGIIGSTVPGLGVGTGVVPINPRHPLIVASQAQTAQAASNGRFSLGLGLGGHELERRAFGQSWPKPVARLREYLTVLRSIFDTESVDFHGDHFSSSPLGDVALSGGRPVPIYIAAMGPKTLQIVGELADGTLPYLAGPRTIAEFIEPTISKAAADAGRPNPEIIAGVPVLVSADADTARQLAAQRLAFYETVPASQRVIAREGVDSVADLAAVGDEDAVQKHLRRYIDAGATSLSLTPLDGDDPAALEAIWRIAASL